MELRGHYHLNHVVDGPDGLELHRRPLPGAVVLDRRPLDEVQVLEVVNAAGVPSPTLLGVEGDLVRLAWVPGVTVSELAPNGTPLPEGVVTKVVDLWRKLWSAPTAGLPAPASPGAYHRELLSAERHLAAGRHAGADLLAWCGLPTAPWDLLVGDADCLALRPSVLCHGDLHRGNLVVAPDGQLVAIDWELAAVGDPAWDVAVFMARGRLTAPDRSDLLAAVAAQGLLPPHGLAADVGRYLDLEATKSVFVDAVRALARPERPADAVAGDLAAKLSAVARRAGAEPVDPDRVTAWLDARRTRR